MRLLVVLPVILVALSIVLGGNAGDRPQRADSEFSPLRGPAPNALVVRISSEIASPDDPVFYVHDPDDRNRLIAYGWDGRRRGEVVVESSEPFGFQPSADGTIVVLAHARTRVKRGGEHVGKVSGGAWAGDNSHFCTFLNELGGRGGFQERRISETHFQGRSPSAYLFVEDLSGDRRRVIQHGTFGPHGGPVILACNFESDRAVIAESFIGQVYNVMMVRLSDGKVLYRHTNSEPRGARGILASLDGALLAEGVVAGFIVRSIQSGEELADIRMLGGMVAFSGDNTRAVTVQYLNNSNEFGQYRVIELATSRVVWSAVLSPGRVLTRPDSADFIVTGSMWEPSGAPDGGRKRFEDMWLIPEEGSARLLLTHSALAGKALP